MSSFSAAHRILILGASSDIGSDLARKLHSEGVSVGLISRASTRFDRICSETGFPSVQIESVDHSEITKAVDTLADQMGPISGGVNLLGTLLLKPAHLTTVAEWRETIAVNLDSNFSFLKSVLQRSDLGNDLSMVFVSSAAAATGLPNHEAIAASKSGVEGLARSAAATYASRGYRFNVVAPGLVDTELTTSITKNDMARRASEAMHPLQKLGSPGEIARVIRWLLSTDSGWITGQVIGVDGGLSTLRTRAKV
jgi:NAD(P)-dependent dehydrogenase (short-subunit alcohol dehydrogenase family)